MASQQVRTGWKCTTHGCARSKLWARIMTGTMPTFLGKLLAATRKNESLLCVGLDPDPALMPEGLDVASFNQAIIEATADLVCCYKPNMAFYEALGIPGLRALEETVKAIPSHIPVLGDGKRGDIGSTAKAYARACFEVWGFDAATVNAYGGLEGTQPFLDYKEKGVFIWCLSSNEGRRDFQLQQSGDRPFFEQIVAKANEWNANSNIGLVVGATAPAEVRRVRELAPTMPLLIPGVGSQSGDLAGSVRFGVDAHGERALINSSRQVLYASKGKDFAEAARKAAMSTREQMRQALPTPRL